MTIDKQILDLTVPDGHTSVSEFFGDDELDDMFETLTDEEMQKLTKKLSEENPQ